MNEVKSERNDLVNGNWMTKVEKTWMEWIKWMNEWVEEWLNKWVINERIYIWIDE